jgi:probable F420-dependent oxidoreductase
LEAGGIDSVWLSERVHAPAVDPWVGLSFAAARTQRLKLGTGVSVLPGRNPVLVAKQVASLRELAPGRVLPAFGLQPADERERAYYPIPDRRRGAVFDESLMIVRGLLEHAEFSFDGEYFHLDRASTGFAPHGLDLWLGGRGPRALSRIGRLADGWLASFISPQEAEAGRSAIEAAAAAADRSIDDDHYGMNIFLAQDGGAGAAALRAARRRPDLDARLLIAECCRRAEGFMRVDVHARGGLSPWLESLGLPRAGGGTVMVRGRVPERGPAHGGWALVTQAIG